MSDDDVTPVERPVPDPLPEAQFPKEREPTPTEVVSTPIPRWGYWDRYATRIDLLVFTLANMALVAGAVAAINAWCK